MTLHLLVAVAFGLWWGTLGLGVCAYRRATRSVGALAIPAARRDPLTTDEIVRIVEQQLAHRHPVYIADGALEISVEARPSSGWWLTIGSRSTAHETVSSLLATLRVQVEILRMQPRARRGAA